MEDDWPFSPSSKRERQQVRLDPSAPGRIGEHKLLAIVAEHKAHTAEGYGRLIREIEQRAIRALDIEEVTQELDPEERDRLVVFRQGNPVMQQKPMQPGP